MRRAEFPDDSQDRARLDDDLEQLAASIVEVEQCRREDQVTRAGDRQELSESFDDPEDRRLQQQHEIHAYQSSEQARQ